MAAGVAARRSAGTTTRVLDQTTSGRASGAAVADRSAAAARPKISRRDAALQPVKRVSGRVEIIEQARRRHALYDAARRAANIALALHRTRRHRGGDADCEPSPRRA